MIKKMVNMEIEIDDKDFLIIAKLAHEKDITFNKMFEEIIKEYSKK